MAKFRTRARTLDLLGRQQIAGIPTAINELIKNAHDAYADKFDIDFLRKDNLLILRDDGLGMTREEFESRWLTIGTESKFVNNKSTLPPIDKNKVIRPIMGEKGIGRLAIASIGEQVLILTKAKNRGSDHRIVAILINWQLFGLAGIDLDDITIPIKEYDSLPSDLEIDELKNELIFSIEELLKKDIISKHEHDKISSTVKSLQVNPADLNNFLVGDFDLSNDKGGTFFYVSPVNETLIYDIEDGKQKEASKIEKLLIGFHNTMIPGHSLPIIDLSFRDYRGLDGSYVNLIDKEEFFTPEDFKLGDHQFQGTFDEYGQFKGNIAIYREKVYEHIVNWNGNNFKATQCGPFKINFAYLQGVQKESIVDVENWNRLRYKGDKFGGLYIYKDNIRILPYGDSDYDFLNIEKNRSKRASTYFFSYRRMFGAIELTSLENNTLSEKAGREGFIENRAYRQLQDILQNFFVQLAADFFDEKGRNSKSEFYTEKKEEINKVYRALERRDKLAKIRKEKFVKELDSFFEKLTTKEYNLKISQIVSTTKSRFNNLLYKNDIDSSSQQLLDYEIEFRQELANYKNSILVSSPKGFTISKDVRKDYELYLKEFQILNDTIFKDASNAVDALVEEYISRLNLELDKRKRLEQAVEFISSEAKKENSRKRIETQNVVNEVSKKIKELTSELMIDLDNQILYVKDSFKNLKISDSNEFDLVGERRLMEEEIDLISNRNKLIMDRIIRQFESFYIDKDNDGNIITNDQISDALAEELDELRERVQTDVELSQLGLAVGVLHHEFSSTIKSIRGSLKDLRAWSDVNSQLEGVYKNIKVNFEHLDGYLNLFTPLNRRLNRRREDISLMEVKSFLIDLFKSRFERHNIQFKHTKGFQTKKIYGFKSAFFPVFVNLIDNAIYWLNQSNADEKTIRLHADDSGIYISNNGIDISLKDKERIFELGFSRKDNGRGMGLSISREVLSAENYSIELVEPREGSTVTFKLYSLKNFEENE